MNPSNDLTVFVFAYVGAESDGVYPGRETALEEAIGSLDQPTEAPVSSAGKVDEA